MESTSVLSVVVFLLFFCVLLYLCVCVCASEDSIYSISQNLNLKDDFLSLKTHDIHLGYIYTFVHLKQ